MGNIENFKGRPEVSSSEAVRQGFEDYIAAKDALRDSKPKTEEELAWEREAESLGEADYEFRRRYQEVIEENKKIISGEIEDKRRRVEEIEGLKGAIPTVFSDHYSDQGSSSSFGYTLHRPDGTIDRGDGHFLPGVDRSCDKWEEKWNSPAKYLHVTSTEGSFYQYQDKSIIVELVEDGKTVFKEDFVLRHDGNDYNESRRLVELNEILLSRGGVFSSDRDSSVDDIAHSMAKYELGFNEKMRSFALEIERLFFVQNK